MSPASPLPDPDSPPWGGTLRVRSELWITGGQILHGDVHLQHFASAHWGPETVTDALERRDEFFPITTEDGQAMLIAKAQVLAVSVPLGADPQDAERLSAARPLRLTVELSDGSTHTGTVACELPPHRSRTLDFLNHHSGFFPLRTADFVRYLNRSHVRVVTPLD
ncbi:MAG TPA: hypothetical protein VL241_06855 [Gemmatimonadales bacterium]|nr:hypothetical protein [Gemmatimonadales bacterium]